MTSRDFVYWFQGYLEINHADHSTRPSSNYSGKGLTYDQLAIVRAHLNMVFKHEIDPTSTNGTAQSSCKVLK